MGMVEITNKTNTTANKVFQSLIFKGKLWILVNVEQSKMTFHFAPQIKENAFLRV